MANGSKQNWMPSVEQWHELFRGLSLNDEDDPLASANEETSFEKICVLVRFSHDTYLTKCFLYYIDLSSAWKYNDNSIQPLHPILQFWDVLDSYNFREYVVVGCKLFMFGASVPGKRDSVRSMCYYDFSGDLCSSTTINVVENSLKSGPPMKSRKRFPVYAVVGGSKICVFETLLYRSFEKGYASSRPPSFEVFNTTDWTWTKLPELPINYSELGFDEIIIWPYCIEGSCLIICTDIGICGINIDAENPKWVKIEGSGRMKRGPFSGRWAMVGEHVCSPFEVARWGEEKAHPLEFVNKESLIPVDGILCSERVDYGYTVCGVHYTFRPETEEPALLVNVTKLDTYSLKNFTGEMWKTIECDKSAIIAIEYEEFESMKLIGCFQIKEKKRSHRVPLHYPRYRKDDYETMEEWRIDLLLSQYGFTFVDATIQEKRDFAMGAFLWPNQY